VPSVWAQLGPLLQPDSTPPKVAHRAFADQLQASCMEGCDEFHDRIDIAAHDIRARLHALDGRERKPRAIGKVALIHVEQGARGTHLQRGDHSTSTHDVSSIDLAGLRMVLNI